MHAEAIDKLTILSAKLMLAKVTEKEARKVCISHENAIAAIIDAPETGQKTVNLPNGFKIVVKKGLNYKADTAGIDSMFSALTDMPDLAIHAMHPPLKSSAKRELDTAGYEWYKKVHPAVFALLREHVTVTPKKIAVTVSPKKE